MIEVTPNRARYPQTPEGDAEFLVAHVLALTSAMLRTALIGEQVAALLGISTTRDLEPAEQRQLARDLAASRQAQKAAWQAEIAARQAGVSHETVLEVESTTNADVAWWRVIDFSHEPPEPPDPLDPESLDGEERT